MSARITLEKEKLKKQLELSESKFKNSLEGVLSKRVFRKKSRKEALLEKKNDLIDQVEDNLEDLQWEARRKKKKVKQVAIAVGAACIAFIGLSIAFKMKKKS